MSASLARKQQNYALSRSLLCALVSNITNQPESLISEIPAALKLVVNSTVKPQDCMRLHRESAKLLFSLGQTREAVETGTNGVMNVIKDFTGTGMLLSELCGLFSTAKPIQVIPAAH